MALDAQMMKYIAIGIAVLVVVALTVLFLRKRKQQAGSDEPSASIALLLSEPFKVEEPAIRRALEKAFGGDFSTNVAGRIVLPVIETAQYMVWAQGGAFILHNVPSSYFPDSEAVANSIQGDDGLAHNVRDHQAWLSFDVLGSAASLSEQYDLIGPVLAEIAPEQTIALFVVEKEVLIRFDAERREQLRGPEVLKKLGFE